jgi:hypothetical protein
MLPAQRAGARGAGPWHTLRREVATKVDAKEVSATQDAPQGSDQGRSETNLNKYKLMN